MNELNTQKPFPKAAILLIILGVAALAIIFVVLATIGDDVPSKLAPDAPTTQGE